MGGTSKWWTRCKTTTAIRVPLSYIAMLWSVHIGAFSFRIGQVFWVPVSTNHSTHIVGSKDHKLKPQMLVLALTLPPNIRIRIPQVRNYSRVSQFSALMLHHQTAIRIRYRPSHSTQIVVVDGERERHAKKLLLSVTSAEPGWLASLLSSVLKSVSATSQKSSYLRKRKRQSLCLQWRCVAQVCHFFLGTFLELSSTSLPMLLSHAMESGLGPLVRGCNSTRHTVKDMRWKIYNKIPKSFAKKQQSLSLSLSLSLTHTHTRMHARTHARTHTYAHMVLQHTHTQSMLKHTCTHTRTHTHIWCSNTNIHTHGAQTRTHIVLVVMTVVVSVVGGDSGSSDRWVFYRRRRSKVGNGSQCCRYQEN